MYTTICGDRGQLLFWDFVFDKLDKVVAMIHQFYFRTILEEARVVCN